MVFFFGIHMKQEWKDIYMRWNESEYDNITKIRVPKGTIWEPDIKLYN